MKSSETGRVVRIQSNTAFVNMNKGTSCTTCNHCEEEAEGKDIVIQVPLPPRDESHVSVHIGDTVQVECSSGGPVKLGFLYLILPIILAIIGYTVSSSVFMQQNIQRYRLWSGLLAGILFILPVSIQFFIRRRQEKSGKQWIRITGVVQNGGNLSCCS